MYLPILSDSPAQVRSTISILLYLNNTFIGYWSWQNLIENSDWKTCFWLKTIFFDWKRFLWLETFLLKVAFPDVTETICFHAFPAQRKYVSEMLCFCRSAERISWKFMKFRFTFIGKTSVSKTGFALYGKRLFLQCLASISKSVFCESRRKILSKSQGFRRPRLEVDWLKIIFDW